MAKPTSKPTNKTKSTKADEPLSLAALWDDTDANEASNRPQPGEHEMRLDSATLSTKEGKGTAVMVKYSVLAGDDEGKDITSFYKLTDADGNKASGMAYLMRDLAILGYEKVPGNKLEKTLKELTDEQPMVIVKVSENGQYLNAFLQGLAEAIGDSESEADDEQTEDVELEEGDRVKGLNKKGDEVIGKITSLAKGKATVEDDDGDDHIIPIEDLEKADEEESEEESEGEEAEGVTEENIGEQVTDGDITGELMKIKGEKAYVEDGEGETHKVDLDSLKLAEDSEESEESEEEEAEEAEEEEWEPEVGDRASFKDGKITIEGTIKKVKGDSVTLKDDDGDIHEVEKDELEKVED